MDEDGSPMAVSLCIKGGCDPGGLGDWQADSITAILLSTDGGITWEEIERRGPALRVVGLLGGGEVLTMNYLEPLDGIEFRTFPGDDLVTPPPGSLDYPPVISSSGDPLWHTAEGGLLLGDGTVFIPERDNYRAGRRLIGDHAAGNTSFVLSVDLSGLEPDHYGVEVYDIAASVPALKRLYQGDQFVAPGWSDFSDNQAIVTIDVPPPPEYLGAPVPALLDLSTGEYHLITDPFVSDQRPHQPYGRSLVDGVQVGPFARVVDTGDCLNVRFEPTSTSQILNCAADGVLLRDMNETREGSGSEWLRVATPAGIAGWASTAFLER